MKNPSSKNSLPKKSLIHRALSFLSGYLYAFIAISAFVLVEFLPYYLQEKALDESFSQPVTGTVIRVERNIFGNAQRPDSDEEKSCTLVYQYPFENHLFSGSYRHNCADFSGLNKGDSMEVLLQANQPTNSKPAWVELSLGWLKTGTYLGFFFLSLGIIGIIARLKGIKKSTD
ncbi:hypothetical protein Ssed_3572 [Shewanella sediminis HAW-EB3]|uniref:DUF3592 domain-containing protein n=1 Tax=Shewanella sediminis (strain HAW-EB3) TaxID=425104 RepID=A8FZA3_SHESH|nr:hypothetical protein [Shewanella sediminis]ABV38176.1 hypothetical protein Ssed_3572 [Shewanella sediminis HAW-EB3]